MINFNTFEKIVTDHIDHQIDKISNPEQHQAISAPITQSQFLVAGPGSGKTTVIVLKILKFIYMDDIHPSSILSSTFTHKAAAELRSRIISCRDQIRQHLLNDLYFKKPLKLFMAVIRC